MRGGVGEVSKRLSAARVSSWSHTWALIFVVPDMNRVNIVCVLSCTNEFTKSALEWIVNELKED